MDNQQLLQAIAQMMDEKVDSLREEMTRQIGEVREDMTKQIAEVREDLTRQNNETRALVGKTLFATTPAGAQSNAVIYSLIETAKENNLDHCWSGSAFSVRRESHSSP